MPSAGQIGQKKSKSCRPSYGAPASRKCRRQPHAHRVSVSKPHGKPREQKPRNSTSTKLSTSNKSGSSGGGDVAFAYRQTIGGRWPEIIAIR